MTLVYLKENYYICRGGDRRNHGGKIANKIANLKQKKRKIDHKELEHAKTLKSSSISQPEQDPIEQKAVQWLRLNQEPWETVLHKWPQSFNHRKPNLQSFNQVERLFSCYSHYKVPHGYQLVSKHSFLVIYFPIIALYHGSVNYTLSCKRLGSPFKKQPKVFCPYLTRLNTTLYMINSKGNGLILFSVGISALHFYMNLKQFPNITLKKHC